MKDQLISFDTAKLAKEKGFKVKTLFSYGYEDGSPKIYTNGERGATRYLYELSDANTPKKFKTCSAPTQSLLQRWLREKHNYNVQEIWSYNDNPHWGFDGTYMNSRCDDDDAVIINTIQYELPTEALEAGLQEALKLIK